jgi:GDP-D-mannose dehydratase
MWRLLQLEKPQDLVFGTGATQSVQEFVEAPSAMSISTGGTMSPFFP